VIARGIERRKIFPEDEDREDFLGRLETLVVKGGAQLLAWSLLPNHFHLLVRSGEIGLSTLMRRLLTGYAVVFNLRHRRHGHLFQNRYKSIVCEEEPYLLELVRYIHLNPLRAKLVSSTEELAQYPHCGHSALMGVVERPWQETGEVLERFGPREARARYEEFVCAGASQGRRPELVGGGLHRSAPDASDGSRRRRRKEEPQAYDERILGGSDFVMQMLREAEGDRREVLRRSARTLTVEELGKRVAGLAGITVGELRGASRRPAVVRARRALAQIAVGELGRPGAQVARYLGVATSTVNRGAAWEELEALAKELLEKLEGR
jgi:REP element-mobilizing transposase RayT